VFFKLRVVALIRGILISLDADVHARMVWRPYAMAALRAAGERIPAWALEQEQEIESGGNADGSADDGAPMEQKKQKAGGQTNVYARMKTLAMWMRENDLPHNRKCLLPIAGAGLMSVQDIADAIGRDDSKVLDAALKKFSGAQRRKLEDAALRDAPKLARKEKMAAEETRIAREKETRARKGAGSGEGGDGGKGGKGESAGEGGKKKAPSVSKSRWSGAFAALTFPNALAGK
jgi:hypothetical protein